MTNTKPLVVVTGITGQLGYEIQQLSLNLPNYQWLFTTRQQLNLSNNDSIHHFFTQYQPQYFINCAAYTTVDKAETETELALQINATAVGLLAHYCSQINAYFITISTDYVFDGNGTNPYPTHYPTAPINAYGQSKLQGEQAALLHNPKSIIIRTSWVYSTHGNNFVKTIKRLLSTKESIQVVNDQVGSPTYAAQLAQAILYILPQLQISSTKGIFHYSNQGIISWLQFAQAIQQYYKYPCHIIGIPSSQYPTAAKRPYYSAMDCSHIQQSYNITIPTWQQALQQCLTIMP